MVCMLVPTFMHTYTMLAQSGARSGEAAMEIVLYAAALLVAVLVVIVVALVVRRWLLGSADTGDAGGFTMAEMRRMHEAGELSDEEWESAKAALRAHTRRAAGVADDVDDTNASPQADESNDPNTDVDPDNRNDSGNADDLDQQDNGPNDSDNDQPQGPSAPT